MGLSVLVALCSVVCAVVPALCADAPAASVPRRTQRRAVKWCRGRWLQAQGFPWPDHNRKRHNTAPAQPERFIWCSANSAGVGQQRGARWVLQVGEPRGALGAAGDQPHRYRLGWHFHGLESDKMKTKLKVFTESQ